jgi:hypothetical protein
VGFEYDFRSSKQLRQLSPMNDTGGLKENEQQLLPLVHRSLGGSCDFIFSLFLILQIKFWRSFI